MYLLNAISRADENKNGQPKSELDCYLGNMSDALTRAQAQRNLKAANLAVEEAIRIRSSFLENMNHELRTPLNAIIGFASMLLNGDEYELDKKKKNSYAEYILQSADLLLGHINTILEVAALDTGSQMPMHADEDMDTILDAALVRIRTRAKSADVTIVNGSNKKDKDPDISVPKIWTDQQKLGQALDHLLQTAIKSCEGGGKILTRIVVDKNDWVQIQIRDDGVGFSEEEITESLDCFNVIETGLQKPFAGPGLGIALAKTFIEMQGGVFTIKSKKGKGTLSTIGFPPAVNFVNQHEDIKESLKERPLEIEPTNNNLAKTA